jgi:hypothetical protein
VIPELTAEILAQMVIIVAVSVLSAAVLVIARSRRIAALRDAALERAAGAPSSSRFVERLSTTVVPEGSFQPLAAAARAMSVAGLCVVGRGQDWCAGGVPSSFGPVLCFVCWKCCPSGGIKFVTTAESIGFDLPILGFEGILGGDTLKVVAASVHGALLHGVTPISAWRGEKTSACSLHPSSAWIIRGGLAAAAIAALAGPLVPYEWQLRHSFFPYLSPTLLVLSVLWWVWVRYRRSRMDA